jgi:hypothetical protein
MSNITEIHERSFRGRKHSERKLLSESDLILSSSEVINPKKQSTKKITDTS